MLEGLRQLGQGEIRRIVEDVAGCLLQAARIEDGEPHIFPLEAYFFHDGLFALFEQTIEPPQHKHRQNHIPVFAPDVYIPQTVVGNRPDERDEFIVY